MLHTRDLILNPKWTGFGDVSAQSAILYSFLCGFALPLTPSGRGCSPRSPAGAVRGRTARSRSRTSCNGAAGGGARSVPSSCRDGSGRSGSVRGRGAATGIARPTSHIARPSVSSVSSASSAPTGIPTRTTRPTSAAGRPTGGIARYGHVQSSGYGPAGRRA
jgi:hypothetical protein